MLIEPAVAEVRGGPIYGVPLSRGIVLIRLAFGQGRVRSSVLVLLRCDVDLLNKIK